MTAIPAGGLAHEGSREKRLVAMSSVVAAIGLTTMKLVVGLISGSLGILSEAAHSGLDLAAAAMTWFAVRVSDKPPDLKHTYGHGKIENISALFETLLLLATCVWIIYEAIQRLFFETVEIEASLWGFLVMGVSIVIDVTRSRALARVARKYNSQALEADALHFSTDVWSSSVVIVGLGLVRLADIVDLPWLVKADAVAALGVAGIVTYVSLQLGGRTISALLDAAPAGLREEIERAVHIPGVVDVRQARIRQSGPETFADLTLLVSPNTSVESAHDIASQAEARVQSLIPGADIVVHLEPSGHTLDSIVDTLRLMAARQGMGAHAIRLQDVRGRRSLALHLEVREDLSLEAAHAQATEFERAVRQNLPEIDDIVTHIEPAGDGSALRHAAPADEALVRQALESIRLQTGLDCDFHELEVRRVAGELSVSFHCMLRGENSILDAHEQSVRMERELRARLPEVGRVVIHVEPLGAEAP